MDLYGNGLGRENRHEAQTSQPHVELRGRVGQTEGREQKDGRASIRGDVQFEMTPLDPYDRILIGVPQASPGVPRRPH
jgi:hypothetical protein